MVSEREIQICKHKRRYHSRILADTWADIYASKYPMRCTQRSYHCPVCGKYHLTCGIGDRKGEHILPNSRLQNQHGIQVKEESLQEGKALCNLRKDAEACRNDGCS